MGKLKENLSLVVFVLLIIGLGVERWEPMPENAIVYVDTRTKTYYGEPTALDEIYLGHKLLKARAYRAYSNGYKPAEKSKDNGDFTGYSSSVIWWYFVDAAGILPNLKRWNPDGTWNY